MATHAAVEITAFNADAPLEGTRLAQRSTREPGEGEAQVRGDGEALLALLLLRRASPDGVMNRARRAPLRRVQRRPLLTPLPPYSPHLLPHNAINVVTTNRSR